jgi:hypothetical protein
MAIWSAMLGKRRGRRIGRTAGFGGAVARQRASQGS